MKRRSLIELGKLCGDDAKEIVSQYVYYPAKLLYCSDWDKLLESPTKPDLAGVVLGLTVSDATRSPCHSKFVHSINKCIPASRRDNSATSNSYSGALLLAEGYTNKVQKICK